MSRAPTVRTVVCGVCEEPFEAKGNRAKFCGATCRSRAHRRKPGDGLGSAKAPGSGAAHPLVVQLRGELEQAGRLDTVAGQLALALALQVTAAGATGIAGLSKELRTVRAEALAGTPAAAPVTAEDEDEVERARRRREEKRAQAGRA